MFTISRKIFLLSVLLVPAFAFAPFATVADAKTALAAAMSGPVANFTKLTQIDPKAATDAIAALNTALTPYASSTVPAIKAAVDDAKASIVTWTATLATIPNIKAESDKLAAAKATLDTAVAALEANRYSGCVPGRPAQVGP